MHGVYFAHCYSIESYVFTTFSHHNAILFDIVGHQWVKVKVQSVGFYEVRPFMERSLGQRSTPISAMGGIIWRDLQYKICP